MPQERRFLLAQSSLQLVEQTLGHLGGLCISGTAPAPDHAAAYSILLKWPSQVGRVLGVWRSLEARFLGMEEAPSSNLGTSTITHPIAIALSPQ